MKIPKSAIHLTLRKRIKAGDVDEVADYISLADYYELQNKNARLIEALGEYGQHTVICRNEKYPEAWHCTCGYDQALKG